jgi:hypothetical protein
MNQIRVDELINRYFDCDLAGDDRASLERTLLSSEAARTLFWQTAETHGLLRKWGRVHWGKVAAASDFWALPRGRRPSGLWGSRAGVAAALAMAAASVVVIIGGIAWTNWTRSAGPAADIPALAADAEGTPATPRLPAFAVLSAAFEPVWADVNDGLMLRRGSLPSGPLELLKGRVELRFASGGTAVIEGPAVFEPIAGDAVRLSTGCIRCRCPEPGTELRVETPEGTITDLGTEFAVSVEAGVRTRVGVVEGKVRVDASDEKRLVTAGQALSIAPTGQASDDLAFWHDHAETAIVIPFDDAAFAAGENVLRAASFEPLPDADAMLDGPPTLPGERNFAFGPWRGTFGYVDLVSNAAATGTQAARIHAKGSPFWPLVWQHLDTGDIGGKTMLASVRVAQSIDDPLADPQQALVKFEFFDASGRLFTSAERQVLNHSCPLGEFVEGRLAAKAPAGTVAVRFQVLLSAAGLQTGSIVVDDAKLVILDRP